MNEKDMRLPFWVCLLGIALLVTAAAIAALFCLGRTTHLPFAVAGIACLCVGIMAILCWKNQWVVVLSDSEFMYSTMLGQKNVYRFAQITGVTHHQSSTTLRLGSSKVHIESCAILSDRFTKALHAALKQV